MATPGQGTEKKRAEKALEGLRHDRERRLDQIDNYLRGRHAGPYMPRTATQEYRLLAQRAISNFLPMVVSAPSQALSVDGYHRSGSSEDAPEWHSSWQANNLDARQAAVYRGAIGYGHSFVVTLRSAKDRKQPVVRGVSARCMWAAYDDPASDEWPLYALELPRLPESGAVKGRYYDEKMVYQAVAEDDKVTLSGGRPHDLGVCPVRRFAAQVDLEGRTIGVVEPLIPLQDRINQTVFDLLIAQTYGSFKIRTVAGMAPPVKRDPVTGEPVLDADGNPVPKPVQMDSSRLLMAPDKDTKFNTLDETPLSGFITSIDMSLRHLAVVSQTPPHYLLGDMVNLSAEALAAAETTLMRMVAEFKRSFGESWESVFRLCSLITGETAGAQDTSAQVQWKDAESRSLSQTADALGKLHEMLDVPAQALWPAIPGFTDTDRAGWADLAAREDAASRFADALDRATRNQGPHDGAP